MFFPGEEALVAGLAQRAAAARERLVRQSRTPLRVCELAAVTCKGHAAILRSRNAQEDPF